MTNEEMLQDLKQFITATVSQQMANVATKDDIADLRAELKADIAALNDKVDLVQDAIAEVVTHTDAVVKATLDDHEQRLRRLERHTA